MNNKRRLKLEAAKQKINSCIDAINNIMDEEEDCVSNIPENLWESDMYQAMEDNVSILETAIESLEDAVEELSKIK